MKKPAKTTTPAAVTTQPTAFVSPVAFPSRPKQQTAREVIAANVKLLIEQLEAGHSEGLTAYLTAMGRFHNYSFGNILEIARQKSDATRVPERVRSKARKPNLPEGLRPWRAQEAP